ncbi:MAG: MBL fold metallo-hydrolase [Flavobacteriales bacterium]|nr:MBL fold metallo-hydrolase [Flavobacteriales bacterium]
MRLATIHTGNFRLDGGAMFGVVPKSIWNRLNPSDENNMCNWAMRSLLVEDGNRLILIDNGIGDKQSEKFFSYYYLNGEHSLKRSLHAVGVDFGDITDVILTHLHFDHCGGSVQWNSSRDRLETVFPNARYWSHRDHWHFAFNPNAREKASFLQENMAPIEEAGQLEFVGEDGRISDNITVFPVYGHTEAMIIPKINYKGRTLVFAADLIPSAAHVPVNYVMAYDIRPLVSMEESELFLREAVENNYTLFYEHDLLNECGTVIQTERGFRSGDTFDLEGFLSE